MHAAVARGGKITYSIQVKNNGPERAGGVVLSDPLPAGTKLVSATTSQGTCAGNPCPHLQPRCPAERGERQT